MRIFRATPGRRHSTAAVRLAWAALLALAPALAAADGQSSQGVRRTALLEAERDRKATETSSPQRSLVERALSWYDRQYVVPRIVHGWNGFHLAGGDFPAGAGMKFGAGFSHRFGSFADLNRRNRLDIDTVAAYSTRGYTRALAALSVRRLGGMPIAVGVRGQHSRFPQEDFFGLGRFSRRENRTDYLLESTEAGAGLQWEPAKPMRLAVGLSYVSPRIGSGTDSRFLSPTEVFDPAELPGFDAQPDFVRSDASLVLDWRDQPQHPHAGGQVGLQVSHSRDQDLDAFSFHRLAIDVQHYVPLPDRYRTVALRATAVLTAPQSGQQVPFFYQPTLGGSQALRGFREFRFKDRNSLLLTAEYRWEASWLLDGALFVDAGKVAFDRRDLTFRDLEVSYGLGFRVHSNSAFVARLDLAFSREGFIPLLRFEHAF